MQSVFDDLDAGKTVALTPDVHDRLVADLKRSGATGIVVGPSPGRAAIIDLLTQIEGSPPTEDGGVYVWRFSSISWGSRRAQGPRRTASAPACGCPARLPAGPPPSIPPPRSHTPPLAL